MGTFVRGGLAHGANHLTERIMRLAKIVRLRLRSLFARRDVEEELDEGFRYHNEQQMEEDISPRVGLRWRRATRHCAALRASSNGKKSAAT